MAKGSKILIKKALAVGESKAQFNNLLYRLRDEFKPKGIYENLLIDKLAIDFWRLKKLIFYEMKHIITEDGLPEYITNKQLREFGAYQEGIERGIQRAFWQIAKVKRHKEPVKVHR